jgi:hypothetical protein
MEEPKGLLWLHLDTASRAQLLELCEPRFSTLFCDHVTLRFDTPLTPEYNAMIGQTHTAHATEVCWNEKIQAVRVDTHDLPDQYGVPHITISATEDTPPFLSVEMLKTTHQRKVIGGLAVTGVIQFIPL